MLGGDVLIAKLLCFLFRAIQDLVELARQGGLRVALLRRARQLSLDFRTQRVDVHRGLLKQGRDDTLVLIEQSEEQVKIVDLRILDLINAPVPERLSA